MAKLIIILSLVCLNFIILSWCQINAKGGQQWRTFGWLNCPIRRRNILKNEQILTDTNNARVCQIPLDLEQNKNSCSQNVVRYTHINGTCQPFCGCHNSNRRGSNNFARAKACANLCKARILLTPKRSRRT